MAAFYNEFDPFAAAWLRELIKAGRIADGVVDERSIKEVQADDLRGFTQCHFFAGIGGWSYAARLAGWPDDRPLWTGSCPCQPFSVAGKGAGTDDERHLWPDFFRLIRAARPPVVMGEQVAGKAGYGWLDGVRADLAGEDYASRGVDIPACAVDAPHIRQRLYWCAVEDRVAHAGHEPGWPRSRHEIHRIVGADLYGPSGSDLVDASGLGRREGRTEHELRLGRAASAGADAWGYEGAVGHSVGQGLERLGRDVDDERGRNVTHRSCASPDDRNRSAWSDSAWLTCHDGKIRRIPEPGFPLLAHGVPARVAKWRGFGNAIVPQEAAQVIGAFMDVEAGR